MTTKTEDILRRVNGLLAKAAGGTTSEEAEALRAKADELMTKYALEAWQLERAQRTASGARPQAIKSFVDFNWYHDIQDTEVAQAVLSMFYEVARHCRVEVAYMAYDSRGRLMPVVGMAPDVEYMQILFTHLFHQMLEALDPQVRPDDDWNTAVVRMKAAGLKWVEIHRRLLKAGLTDKPTLPRGWDKLYTAYCREHGIQRVYVAPQVYQRSFISGFNSGLRYRLIAQREAQGQNNGSMALALRDYREDVKQALFDMFPEHKPKEVDPNAPQPKAKARRGRGPAPKKIDWATVGTGREAGEAVEIIGADDTSRQRIAGQLS